VGRYNEFENLRIAGVRLADMRGYAYDRQDVTGRGLANAYAQTLGTIFSSGGEKPYEVEIFVAEVGDAQADDQVYRLTYDGQVADEHRFAVMGGSAERAGRYLEEHYAPDTGLDDTVRLAVVALSQDEGTARTIRAGDLEVAVLDRTRSQQRKFRRVTAPQLAKILGNGDGPAGGADAGPPGGGHPSTDPTPPDDPTDPTDTISSRPPLESPTTGEPEPPVAPPVAP